MCPFKEEIIEQLNEAKRKEREIRLSNFKAMETQPEEENKKSTESKLPFRQKWLLKETREDRYIDHSYKNVNKKYYSSIFITICKVLNKKTLVSDYFNK